jgi:hypothetical protein
MKVYGALEVAQLEWFTNAGKPAAASFPYRAIWVTDLKQVQVSDGGNWVAMPAIGEANTFTAANIFNSDVTVKGNFLFGTPTIEPTGLGSNAAYSNVEVINVFTGATTSIGAFSNVATGQILMVINNSGASFALVNEDTTNTAANRIVTGTGADLTIENGASAWLVYNSNTSRWNVVGGSGSSTSTIVEYITNGNALGNTNGWATYADAAGTRPVDGTGGAANVTWTRVTSSPLAGTGSFLFTKDAVNRQGQGASYDFTIDSCDQAKVMQITGEMIVASGTFVAGTSTTDSDLIYYVYDKTNGVLIEPSSFKFFSNSSTNATTFIGNFQTASNSTAYRLIIHCASTSASAYTVKFDRISVAPCKYVYGTNMSDPELYTPTYVGMGTVSPSTVYRSRRGNFLKLTGEWTPGTCTVTTPSMTFPAGLSLDTTKVPSGISVVGRIEENTAGSGDGSYYVNILVDTANPTFIYFGSGNNSGTPASKITDATAFFASGRRNMISYCEIPISGWAASVQASDVASGRLIAAQVASTSPTIVSGTVAAGTAILAFGTVARDTHSAYNTSTGVYTIPEAGTYRFSASVHMSGSGASGSYITLRVKRGGTDQRVWNCFNAAAQTNGFICAGSTTLDFVAGDQITVNVECGFTAAAFVASAVANYFTIEKVQAPQAISLTELVACTYKTLTSTTVTASTQLKFTTKLFDTHGAFDAATGTFTAPYPGKYRVSYGGTYTSASVLEFSVLAGGATYGPMVTATTSARAAFSVTVSVTAGQTIQVIPAQSVTAGDTNGVISIERIGL